MDNSAKEVIYQPEAIQSIVSISKYITEKGFMETAKNFVEKLYNFGDSLAIFPEKYPICRFMKFARRNLHCAVFHKNYIFIYKVDKDKLIVYNVVHSKRLIEVISE